VRRVVKGDSARCVEGSVRARRVVRGARQTAHIRFLRPYELGKAKARTAAINDRHTCRPDTKSLQEVLARCHVNLDTTYKQDWSPAELVDGADSYRAAGIGTRWRRIGFTLSKSEVTQTKNGPYEAVSAEIGCEARTFASRFIGQLDERSEPHRDGPRRSCMRPGFCRKCPGSDPYCCG